MSWFTKKEEKPVNESLLPDLPNAPAINPDTELNSEEVSKFDLPEVEINELPELPNSQQNLQPAIKPPFNNQGMQKSRFEPISSPKGDSQNMPPTNRFVNLKEERQEQFESKKYSSKEPVYIRLDKFETTLESFEEIKNKVIEIEKLLSKSKEIKAEEEKELEEWEHEVHAIKSRLDSIDKNMFSRYS